MIFKATDQAFTHTHTHARKKSFIAIANLYISQSQFGQLFRSNYSMATKDNNIIYMYPASHEHYSF